MYLTDSPKDKALVESFQTMTTEEKMAVLYVDYVEQQEGIVMNYTDFKEWLHNEFIESGSWEIVDNKSFNEFLNNWL